MFIVVLGLRSYAQAALYLWQVRATPWLQRMDFLLQRLLLKTSGVGGTQASVDVVHRLSCPEVGGVPRPEIESTSPAQIGRFLTTGPPGKSICLLFKLSEQPSEEGTIYKRILLSRDSNEEKEAQQGERTS